MLSLAQLWFSCRIESQCFWRFFGFFALPFFCGLAYVCVHRWVIGFVRVAFILTLRSSGTSPQPITVQFFRFLR